MSFEEFLNHKCDIYHLSPENVVAGYGIQATTTKRMNKEADEVDIPCHFHTVRSGLSVVQSVPFRELEGYVKLTLPAGTDVRINDYIRDCESGFFYRAGKPTKVHGDHHIIVDLNREDGVKGAI